MRPSFFYGGGVFGASLLAYARIEARGAACICALSLACVRGLWLAALGTPTVLACAFGWLAALGTGRSARFPSLRVADIRRRSCGWATYWQSATQRHHTSDQGRSNCARETWHSAPYLRCRDWEGSGRELRRCTVVHVATTEAAPLPAHCVGTRRRRLGLGAEEGGAARSRAGYAEARGARGCVGGGVWREARGGGAYRLLTHHLLLCLAAGHTGLCYDAAPHGDCGR
jgi:hypothetical protein